jgi:hypothetical protein
MSQTKLRFGIFITVSGLAASSYAASMVAANYVLQGTTCPTCGINDPTRLSRHDQDTNSISGKVSLSDSLSSNAPGVDYLEKASAAAGVGNLHGVVSGGASAVTGLHSEGSCNAIASAEASWNDSVTISAPDQADGASITLHASLSFHGTFTANAAANPPQLQPVQPCTSDGICFHQSMSGAGAQVAISGAAGFSGVSVRGLEQADGTGIDNRVELPDTIPFDIVTHVGSTIDVRVDLTVSGDVSAKGGELIGDSSSGFFEANFGETLFWGGISSVTDDSGAPIANWSIASDSGFDYSKPFVEVPEPSVFLLVVTPLVMLVPRRNV